MTTSGEPRLLVMDCSSQYGYVGVIDQSAQFGQQLHTQKHGLNLLETIRSLLHQAKITLCQLHAIALVTGPGSLTGIRLAHSVAQGLSLATSAQRAYALPLLALDSLALLGWQAICELPHPPGWVMIDARMQKVYIAKLASFSHKTFALDGRIQAIHNLDKNLEQPILFRGENDTKTILGAKGYTLTQIHTNPQALFDYARATWQNNITKPPELVQPRYLAPWQAQ